MSRRPLLDGFRPEAPARLQRAARTDRDEPAARVAEAHRHHQRPEQLQDVVAAHDERVPVLGDDVLEQPPQPGVEPATPAQQDSVDVYPDRLEVPEAMTEVLAWEPGRMVASAPGASEGKNPLGFARPVAAVAHVPPMIVVTTTAVAIEEVLQGDVQLARAQAGRG